MYGGKEFRCRSELLKGCQCFDPQAESVVLDAREVHADPKSPILSPNLAPHYGRLTTATEPPPIALVKGMERVYKNVSVCAIL
jgi:hypothetical protein